MNLPVRLALLVRAALAAALLSLALVALPLVSCARRAERCWVCEREIHSQVRAVITLETGREVVACCPRCALHYRDERGGARAIAVTDYSAGRSMPLQSAWLVEGSDETPCIHAHPVRMESGSPAHVCYDRCMPSLVAFRDPAEARAFLAEHGGELRPPGNR